MSQHVSVNMLCHMDRERMTGTAAIGICILILAGPVLVPRYTQVKTDTLVKCRSTKSRGTRKTTVVA